MSHIEERLMQLGQVTVDLVPDTPYRIRNGLQCGDNIVVTPSRGMINAEDRSYLYGRARYRGVLLERSLDRLSWTGTGMLWFLSSASGIGMWTYSITHPSATNWPGHMTRLLAAAGPYGLGGFTVATFNSTGGTPSGTWPDDPDSGADAPEETLDYLVWLARTLGVEFWVDPDGTFYAGRLGSTLFQGTTAAAPNVIAIRGEHGRDINLRALDCDWDGMYDVWDFAHMAYVKEQTGDTWQPVFRSSTPPAGTYLGAADGDAGAARAVLEDNGAANNVDAAARGAALLVDHVEAANLTLRAKDRDVRYLIKPGDWMHVHAPEIGYYDIDEQTTFHGRHYNPARVRVMSMRYPIEPQMGVYAVPARTADTREILDLTDYVETSTDATTLELGSPTRPFVGLN